MISSFPRAAKPQTYVSRTEGFFTILGRIPETGQIKPLLHMRVYETQEEAEAQIATYAKADKNVDFLVMRLVAEIKR